MKQKIFCSFSFIVVVVTKVSLELPSDRNMKKKQGWTFNVPVALCYFSERPYSSKKFNYYNIGQWKPTFNILAWQFSVIWFHNQCQFNGNSWPRLVVMMVPNTTHCIPNKQSIRSFFTNRWQEHNKSLEGLVICWLFWWKYIWWREGDGGWL